MSAESIEPRLMFLPLYKLFGGAAARRRLEVEYLACVENEKSNTRDGSVNNVNSNVWSWAHSVLEMLSKCNWCKFCNICFNLVCMWWFGKRSLLAWFTERSFPISICKWVKVVWFSITVFLELYPFKQFLMILKFSNVKETARYFWLISQVW